jgi:hypothetical protein
MVDLGYTLKTAEDLKANILDPSKLLSQFEREAIVREREEALFNLSVDEVRNIF